jgi:hypothetical protein
MNDVLLDGPTARGAVTSWRVYRSRKGNLLWSSRWSGLSVSTDGFRQDLAAVVGGGFGMDEETADLRIV